MSHFDINEFTIAPENSRKIGRVPYGVRLIFYNAVRCPAGHRPMKLYKTPAGARTICDHARENSKKSSDARAIIKFAGDVQIGEIVRCQFYL